MRDGRTSRLTVSLNFMPAFFHKHLGLTYGEAYYFDPAHRASVECAESRFLHEILGRHGVGSARPCPSPVLFIQPIDLLKATQGTPVHCPPDATLETRGHAWADLSVEEILRLDPRAAAAHPFMDRLLDQYRELRRLYGDGADLFGIRSGLMNIHAPFTTAHQLLGEKIFYLLEDDPAGARAVFRKIGAFYGTIFGRIREALEAPPATRLQLGDCSASLLSSARYRETVLPVNRALAAAFPSAGYHSCGPSSHLLEAFAELPGVTSMELGPGTDLAAAVDRLPGLAMRPLVDPLALRDGSSETVARLTQGILSACSPAPSTELCAWSLDRETPIEAVEALYEVVEAGGGNG